MDRYIAVHITVPSEEEGDLIAKSLVNARLAASVNMIPIRSFYNWENILCDDSEFLLIVKTKDYLFRKKIIPTVKSLHSYEITEILALPIVDASEEYLKWIDESVLSRMESYE